MNVVLCVCMLKCASEGVGVSLYGEKQVYQHSLWFALWFDLNV